MIKALFISDVHLGGFSEFENNSIQSDFFDVLNWAKQQNYRIIFLGDLFDYWMEYPNGSYPTEYDMVIQKLIELKHHQNELKMITGNHDNWTRDYFIQHEIHIEKNYLEVSLDEKKTALLMHGDGLFRKNKHIERPLFHRLLRNSLFVSLFQFLFKDKMGLSIMKQFSILNRKYRPTDEKSAEKLTTWFNSEGFNLPYSYILCGHDHIPRVIRKKDTVFVNCGAFCYQRTAALTINQGVNLVYWDKITKQFKPFSHNHE